MLKEKNLCLHIFEVFFSRISPEVRTREDKEEEKDTCTVEEEKEELEEEEEKEGR